MRILHINSNFLYTTLFEKMIESFRQTDHDVFSPISGTIHFTITPKSYVKHPVVFSKWDRFFFSRKQSKILRELEHTYEMANYQLVHAHTLFTDGHVAYTLKKKYNVPYVVAVRNTDVNLFFKYRINLRKKGVNILLEANKIVFLSNAYKEQVFSTYIPKKYHQQLQEKSVIIPNGIDEFWFQQQRNNFPENKVSKNQLNIVYAGKINKNKNIHTSLKAIQQLIENGFDITFSIAGEIQDQSVFDEMNKYDFVTYKGVLNQAQLVALYRENDVFLMPSYTETFGLVYAEALSQGLPVIYSKGQGFDQQFEDGWVGFAVTPNSVNEIVEAIVKIAQQQSQLSQRALQSVGRFNWQEIGAVYEKMYKMFEQDGKKHTPISCDDLKM